MLSRHLLPPPSGPIRPIRSIDQIALIRLHEYRRDQQEQKDSAARDSLLVRVWNYLVFDLLGF